VTHRRYKKQNISDGVQYSAKGWSPRRLTEQWAVTRHH